MAKSSRLESRSLESQVGLLPFGSRRFCDDGLLVLLFVDDG